MPQNFFLNFLTTFNSIKTYKRYLKKNLTPVNLSNVLIFYFIKPLFERPTRKLSHKDQTFLVIRVDPHCIFYDS